MTLITVLGESETTIEADVVGDAVAVAASTLPASIGWTLKPEGLCRGSVCVPVSDVALNVGALNVGVLDADARTVDLGAVADALHAPYAAEIDLGVVAVGEPAPLRNAALDDVHAPDFTLARLGGDHDGEPFTFSTIGAKKKLLVAWASW